MDAHPRGADPVWPRVRWLMLLSVALGATSVFVLSGANALFLEAFGAEWFPYLYLANFVSGPAATKLLLVLERRLNLARFVRWVLALTCLGLLLLWGLLVSTEARPVVFAAAVFMELTTVLLSIAFWLLAGRLFDLREAKRLYGVLGSGEVLATAVFGVSVAWIVAEVGTRHLLALAGVGAGLALLCADRALRLGEERIAAGEPDGGEPARPTRAQKLYMMTIYGQGMLVVAGYYYCDGLFYRELETRYPSADAASAFIGYLLAGVGLATFALRLAAGPILTRLGLFAGLLVQPLAMSAVALAIVFSEDPTRVFWLVIALKAVERVTCDSLTRSGREVLFLPLPAHLRAKTLVISRAVIERVAGGLAGGFIILLVDGLGWELPALVGLLIVLGAGWMAGMKVQSRLYVRTLLRGLRQRSLGGGGGARPPLDAEALGVVRARLESEHEGEVLACLDLLEGADDETLAELLPPRLGHPSAYVRRKALDLAARAELLDAAALDPLAADDDPEVRCAAVRARAQLAGPAGAEAREALPAQARDPDPARRRGALIALLELTDAAEAPRLFAELLGSADPAARTTALEAAGRLGRAELWPLVAAALRDDVTRAAAVRALARAGREAVPHLMALAGDPTARGPAIRLCGRIGGPEAARFLLELAQRSELATRRAALRALAAFPQPATPDESARAQAIAEEELDLLRELAAAQAGRADPGGDLERALREVRARASERLLLALARAADAEAVALARLNLAEGSPERRANAVELLESVLPPGLARRVAGALEATPAAGATDAGAAFPAWLEQPPAWATSWVLACARARGDGPEAAQAAQLLERVRLLRGATIFRETTDHALAELAGNLREEELAAGATLIAEGAAGDSLFLVASGTLEVRREEVAVAELTAGSVVGELAVLDGQPRSASVVAREPVSLLRLERAALEAALGAHEDLVQGVLRGLARQVRAASREVS